MKKILIAASAALLFSATVAGVVLAADSTGTVTTTTTTTNSTMLTCVASAIAKRESAIQAAFATLSDSWKSALTTRVSDLAAAWTMTDKTVRRTAIKEAWKKFADSKKLAKKTYNDARKVAWSQFATDRKDCRASNTGENAGGDAL